MPGYDRKPHRWRHLDTCQFTALLERFVIDLLRECTVQGGANLLRTTWDEAWRIKARAVARSLTRRGHNVVARLGVDEKAIAKRHRYLTMVADLDRSRVLYLAEDRTQESLDGFWSTLTAAPQARIEAAAMVYYTAREPLGEVRIP